MLPACKSFNSTRSDTNDHQLILGHALKNIIFVKIFYKKTDEAISFYKIEIKIISQQSLHSDFHTGWYWAAFSIESKEYVNTVKK